MDKISIIIPVYNVEPYIRKCLDSVIGQTYTNLEILLIDDGSTDNSGKICDEYADKDRRVKAFHKKNGGVSSTKNFGLKHITGKYTGFVDSDDWLEPDMYESLYKAIKDRNVHISVASYYKDIGAEFTPMVNNAQISNGIIDTKDMLLYPLKRDLYMGFCGYLWNKLFSSKVILVNGLSFDEDINYGEDILFYTSVVLSGKCTGTYIDRPLYHYYQRNTSISKSNSSSIKSDILIAYKRVEELMNNTGYSDDSFWARGFYCYHASVVAELAFQDNDKATLILMQREIKNHLEDYINTNREFPEKVERMRKLIELKL